MADKKWIKKAIKRPGALRKKMGVKEGEKIPDAKLDKTVSRLRKTAKGDKKLSAAQRRLLQQASMAQTLRGMNKD